MTSPQRRPTLIVALLMAALAAAALRDLARLGANSPWTTMDEFADFYCAGSALNERVSPYTYEPLRSCEHRVNTGDSFRGRLFARDAAIAVPAPQPAYDFIPFMALARIPPATARLVDGVAILAAVALCVVALCGLGVPVAVAAAALALSTAYVELNTAQVVPFALLALVLGGLALARNRNAVAGVAAALTIIEPTAGVPVILAALVFVPRARLAVMLTLLALALVTLGALGPRGVEQYIAGVLPAHAASELRFPFQYSLTYALAVLGVPSAVARFAGAVSYLVLLAIALRLAPRAATALRRRELLIFVPALCSVIAGPFLHQEELCFALPALLVVAIASSGRARTVAAAALCVLSIPWIAVWGIKQLFLASVFVCATILLGLRVERWAAIATVAGIAIVVYAFELHPPHLPIPTPSAARAYAATELVQREWGDYTRSRDTTDLAWLAIKIPAWAALIAALAIVAALSSRSRAEIESSRESSRETRRLPTA
ncbi:MAG: hypothetical protein JO190_05070 [Candidatus Eremiobacteraeota bacterium]|nr:hypothetical protein [Candidatus Eremiobacteraeota bacterium]MBV8497808.1 hypothetical protein [Candidatus Eremiobacteraeota bacterium]